MWHYSSREIDPRMQGIVPRDWILLVPTSGVKGHFIFNFLVLISLKNHNNILKQANMHAHLSYYRILPQPKESNDSLYMYPTHPWHIHYKTLFGAHTLHTCIYYVASKNMWPIVLLFCVHVFVLILYLYMRHYSNCQKHKIIVSSSWKRLFILAFKFSSSAEEIN